MIEFSEHVNNLIESKLTLVNINADEEKNINDIIMKMSTMKTL